MSSHPTVEIVPARPDQWPEAAALLARLAAAPEGAIVQLEPSADRVLAFLGSSGAGERLLLASAGGALVGAAAWEPGGSPADGWLIGPAVEADAWDRAARPLLEAALAHPGAPSHRALAGVGVENLRLDAHLRDAGFVPNPWANALLTAPPRPVPAPTDVDDILPGRLGEISGLHDALFPETDLIGAVLAERVGRDLLGWTVSEGGGYLIGETPQGAGELFIHFIGVDPEARRRGLGRRLVLHALDAATRLPGVERAALTVRLTNEAAVALYESLGFVTERRYRGYTLILGG